RGGGFRLNRSCLRLSRASTSAIASQIKTWMDGRRNLPCFSFGGGHSPDPPAREQRSQGCWLERFCEHLDILRARLFAHTRATIGSNQNSVEIVAKAAAQFANSIDAVSRIEVIVDQKPIRQQVGFQQDVNRRFEFYRLEYATAPPAKQGFHSLEDCGLIIDT